ncbi:hypothetical protein FH608_046200 [Nonomuraea phyllanthi]|uniref:Uncharacterized protein n=1 Tax=Nonomuraea phyllanthi TaxID=2219224 RepID=A0A5C4V6B9_9ACTN|nr:hypothetical protein [Nonomuraea phyllanthi]KAB8186887.1 hypothetical protein FH608_046200 [Nonomuraea phyllanthi]
MADEYDPSLHGSYGRWLREKGVQTRAGGWTNATHDQVREGVGEDGRRFKVVTDQLGNDVIQHGNDQQSVHIKSTETIRATVATTTSSGANEQSRG